MEQASSLCQCWGHCLATSQENRKGWAGSGFVMLKVPKQVRDTPYTQRQVDRPMATHPGICILTAWKKIYRRRNFQSLRSTKLKKLKDAEFNKQMIPMNLQSE